MDSIHIRTHAGRAAVELRRRILAGVLPGGTRLFEVTVAESLAISRTPVREAMGRLAEEGLLERLAGGGFAVRSFSIADVVDAIELRAVLEGTAARLAAERGVPGPRLEAIGALVARLDRSLGDGFERLDFDAFVEVNGEFHDALAALPGSDILRRELARTIRLPFASHSSHLAAPAEAQATWAMLHFAQEQHRNIVAAIAAREGARAEAIAREHARVPRRRIEALVSGGPEAAGHFPGLALVVDEAVPACGPCRDVA